MAEHRLVISRRSCALGHILAALAGLALALLAVAAGL